MLQNWIKFFTESNRWKHFLAGAVIGAVTLNPWDALVASGAAGAACEYKDKTWGGKWDWTDFACTLAGGLLGYGLRTLIALLW